MVARVYGVYAPRSDERDRWEKIAAEQDAAREAQHAKKMQRWVPLWVPHLRNDASQPRQVIGSSIAGARLEPATPAL